MYASALKSGIAGAVLILWVGTAAAGQFGNPKIIRVPPRRTYHVEHYALALHFDQSAGEVFGTETLRLRPLAAGLRRLYLDSADLHIDSVRDATLHDAKADADYPSTVLVDHELGQACRDIRSGQRRAGCSTSP